ncbi:MAG: glycosyltransferase family 39 protein [Pseudomonadales bacterium]
MRMSPRRALHLAIGLYTGIHLLLAALLPLAAHEAHYAGYAREPALSYLDHPPLAAWLQAPVVALADTDFALRLVPIGLSVLAMVLLARLARQTYPDGSAWLPVIAVLILQGTLVFHGSLTLSPDSPLLPLALGTVLVAQRCFGDAHRPGLSPHWQDWLLLGGLIGLAGLAKYTAVTLALSVLLLAVQRAGWRVLLPGRLWGAGLVALAMIGPVLLWNWQNDWVTVAFHSDYQFEDVVPWSLQAFLLSSAEQLAYYSPLLVVGGVSALWVRGRARGRHLLEGREGVLIAFVLPVLVLYGLTALASRASPHWSMLGWLLLIPVLAAWLISAWSRRPALRALTWLSGMTSVAVLLALPLLAVPVGTWPDFRHPARQLQGWSEASARGVGLLEDLPSNGFPGSPVLLARNWHHAGLLAWYAPDVPVLNLFHDLNPHNLMRGYSDRNTWGVLVYPRADLEPRGEDLTRDFACSPLEAMPVYFGRSLVQVFHFYACYSRMDGAPTDRVARRPR